METRLKHHDRLNLSGLTALDSATVKQLSKSQSSLYRVSPLLTYEEASVQILQHGHSQGDINRLQLAHRASSAKERRLVQGGIRKSSTSSSPDSLKKSLAERRSFDIARGSSLTCSMPSLSDNAETPPTQLQKRQGHRYSQQRKSLKSQSALTLMDYGETSLTDFVGKYGNSLPLRVQIQNGYHFPSNPVCLSTGDVCNVYFTHPMEVINGEIQGSNISIPLYSDMQFCLVHNPDCNIERALLGYEYESIRDVIAANPRPKVIRSLSHCEDGHVTIDDDDILVVNGTVLFPRDDTMWLEVFSLKFHTVLQLHPKCSGIFTTRPLLIPLYLSDIAEYVPEPFPCKVLIYAHQQVANNLETKVIDLQSRSVETIIVCSQSASIDPLLALPARSSVTVTLGCFKKDSNDAKLLGMQAKNVLANFSPSVCVYLAEVESSSVYEFQSRLYRTIKRDKADAFACEPSKLNFLSPRNDNKSFFETPKYRPIEVSNASQVRKISCEPQMGMEHMFNLAQGSFEIVEASSASSLSDGSALSSSEPTPPTPPRPWRRCGSLQEEIHVLHEQPYGSEESLYLSPLCSQAPSVFNLYSFARRYSTQFPVKADVKDGYVTLKGTQISRGDVLTVHGIAYTQAVSVKDDQLAKVYILPMDATSEFGVLQDDSFRRSFGDETEFETIGDILANEMMPTILCARSPYNGGNQKCSIEANEVLVVRKAKKLTKVLKVYSVTMEMKKNLAAKCAGHFTTAPKAVKLAISKLLRHFPSFLPGKAVAFPDTYCSELPAQLEYNIVTLASIHPANSLIFSCSSQEILNGELDLFSVSLDHFLHLQPCDVPVHQPAITCSKSIPQINVSTTPQVQRGSVHENSEWKEDNIKFLATLNENNVRDHLFVHSFVLCIYIWDSVQQNRACGVIILSP